MPLDQQQQWECKKNGEKTVIYDYYLSTVIECNALSNYKLYAELWNL